VIAWDAAVTPRVCALLFPCLFPYGLPAFPCWVRVCARLKKGLVCWVVLYSLGTAEGHSRPRNLRGPSPRSIGATTMQTPSVEFRPFTGRTFGVEIECMMPAGATSDRGREAVARALRAVGIDARAAAYGHTVTSHWRVLTDNSLGYDHGVEIVSPIMRDEEGIAEMRTVMRALSEFGCAPTAACGFHVHIYARDLTPKQVARVAKCFIKFETFFDLIQPASRRANNNRYVASNRAFAGGGAASRTSDYSDASANRALERIDGALLNAGSNALFNVTRSVQASRFYKLNLEPLTTYGTIEFRHAAGTCDADKAEQWVRLLTAFLDSAAVSRPRARHDETVVTPSEELERFFRMFRIARETREFFRARFALFQRSERPRSRVTRAETQRLAA